MSLCCSKTSVVQKDPKGLWKGLGHVTK